MDDNRRSTSPGPHNTDTVRLAELFATGKVGCPTLAAFQASARGGYLSCRLIGERAVLGGNCVTVIEGGFRLP